MATNWEGVRPWSVNFEPPNVRLSVVKELKAQTAEDFDMTWLSIQS